MGRYSQARRRGSARSASEPVLPPDPQLEIVSVADVGGGDIDLVMHSPVQPAGCDPTLGVSRSLDGGATWNPFDPVEPWDAGLDYNPFPFVSGLTLVRIEFVFNGVVGSSTPQAIPDPPFP